MDEEALPRRIMHVTPMGQRKTGRLKARWSWKGYENVMNQELVVYSYEQRTEATFKGGHDS
jgi:hypothetical protein